ncbi:MAG: hypothetical protein ABWZ01_00075 [Methyloceanibacter sp.]
MTAELLAQVSEAFKSFDALMDPILDREQDRALVGAISIGLAIRLVAYATQAQQRDAEPIALSLVRELASMKRQMKSPKSTNGTASPT